jgi:hypothetical protein
MRAMGCWRTTSRPARSIACVNLEVRVANENECLVTFPVRGGVGRLATRLTALAASHQIGEWHIGHWVDWRHTAIRINFDTVADAALAKSTCQETATASA